jgi:hypothetical protein
MRTVVFTSDNHSWLLKGFFHQWQKYGGGEDVEVAGFTPPAFLPKNVRFTSIGKFEDYPVTKWSDAIIRYLQDSREKYILFLLEDYWLMRPVHVHAISAAVDYLEMHPSTIRFDVAADRMFSKNAKFSGSWGPLDICKCKGDYSLSFQASIFRREMLLDVMRPGETPWQAELDGTYRLNLMRSVDVVGSYQWPMQYMVVMNKGQLDVNGDWMYPARSLSESDWAELRNLGCLEPEDVHE